MQGYAEIVSQQQREYIITESTRVWLTNTYTAKHFSDCVRGSIRDDIVKRIIVNGQTDSSCHFKRFNRLNVIMTFVQEAKAVISG